LKIGSRTQAVISTHVMRDTLRQPLPSWEDTKPPLLSRIVKVGFTRTGILMYKFDGNRNRVLELYYSLQLFD